MKKRAHILVLGLVQGVSFRVNTQVKAKSLKLFGWVKNLDKGRVEIIVEGEGEKIKELIKWVKKGPSVAKVARVNIDWEKYQGKFRDFEIVY